LNIKKEFNDYLALKLECELIAEEKEKVRTLMEGTTGQLKPVVVEGGKPSHGFQEEVPRDLELESKLECRQSNLVKQLNRIEELIGLVDDPMHRNILRLRYVSGYKWQAVADKTNYCLRYAKEIRNMAIDEIERKIKHSTL